MLWLLLHNYNISSFSTSTLPVSHCHLAIGDAIKWWLEQSVYTVHEVRLSVLRHSLWWIGSPPSPPAQLHSPLLNIVRQQHLECHARVTNLAEHNLQSKCSLSVAHSCCSATQNCDIHLQVKHWGESTKSQMGLELWHVHPANWSTTLPLGFKVIFVSQFECQSGPWLQELQLADMSHIHLEVY